VTTSTPSSTPSSTPESTPRSTRRRSAVTVVGAAGLVGGIVVGGTMVATAADPTPVYQNTAIECVGLVAVPAPAAPVYTTKLFAGSSKASGTATPNPTTFAGVVPTGYRFEITTQYDTTKSGGGKTDVATVTVPGHVYRNPLLFNIPPVINTLLLAASPGTTTTTAPPADSVPFSVQTTGKATALVTVNMFASGASSTQTRTVLGTVCPAGTTRGANFTQGLNNPRPGVPANVVATGGDTTNAPQTGNGAPAAPNNGSATVTFTKPADTGSGILAYTVRSRDLTDPSARDQFTGVGAQKDGTPTGPAFFQGGLNTTHMYSFTVFAETQNEVSIASAPSNAVTPRVATGTTPAGAAPAQAAPHLATK